MSLVQHLRNIYSDEFTSIPHLQRHMFQTQRNWGVKDQKVERHETLRIGEDT